MSVPKVQTKDDYIKEVREKEGEKAATFQMMFGIVGSNTYTSKPTYGSQDEVRKSAFKDIHNLEFGEMGEYIDSLVQIADHWQEYAEHYYDELVARNVVIDENGYVDLEEN